jgi:FkbM family methyltransferase
LPGIRKVRVKRLIKSVVLRCLDVHPLKNPPPRGYDFFADVRNALRQTKINRIFDVGANVGQSARDFLINFPDAEIYSFEPAPVTYEQLCQELAGTAVKSFNLALGSSNSTRYLEIDPTDSKLNKVSDEGGSQVLDVQTLDYFCKSHGVNHIGFLKIDTEGYDLEVLKGADRLLANGMVDIIEVEAGMNPANKLHVPLEDLKAYLEQRSYFMFALYEQWSEWKSGSPVLRRCNAVFISRQVAEANM